jgi:hypothetical protein
MKHIAVPLFSRQERIGKYHLPQWSGYSQINWENRVEFGSTAEAEVAVQNT